MPTSDYVYGHFLVIDTNHMRSITKYTEGILITKLRLCLCSSKCLHMLHLWWSKFVARSLGRLVTILRRVEHLYAQWIAKEWT